MKKRKYEEKLFIDMPFGEALERYAGVDPKEMHANIDKAKRRKKKPPGGGEPSGGRVVSYASVRLRGRRKSHDG